MEKRLSNLPVLTLYNLELAVEIKIKRLSRLSCIKR